MNINAQELMLVRKNMKFGESQPTEQPTTTATEPVSKPENGMKTLELQANNNIAFQGVDKTILNTLRKKTAAYLIAGLMGVATPALMTSCIETKAWVDLDETVLSDIKNLLETNNELLRQMLEKLNISIELQLKALEIQTKNGETLEEIATSQKLTYEETKKISTIINNGLTSIIAELKAMGATDEEIKAALDLFNSNVDSYLQAFLAQGGTYEDLLKKIEQAMQDALKSLGSISEQLQNHTELLKEILAQQNVSNEIQQKALEIQDEQNQTLKDLVTLGKLNYEETLKISNTTTQGIANIITILKNMGATDEEIKVALNAFSNNVDKYFQEFLTKGGSFEDLLQKIEQAMQDAVKLLDSILKEIQALRADMNKNFENLNSTMLDQTTVLKMIFLEEQEQTALLDSMKNNQEDMAKDLAILKEDNKILAKYVVENGDKILVQLASMDKNSEAFLEEIEKWNLLGVDIRAILEKHSVNTDEGMKALKEAVENNGNKLDKLTELIDMHFANANEKLAFIAKFLPELKKDPELKGEIEKLIQIIEENTNAVNKNSEITAEGIDEMKGINAKLDKILEKMDKLIDNTSNFARYFEDQKENWATLFIHLANGSDKLDEIIKNQKIGNNEISALRKDFNNMKETVKNIESYAYILTQQMNKIQKSIDELEINGGNVGGMTVEEYYNATLELDAINRTNQAEDIRKIIEETVSNKLITVNQWLESIDGKLINAKDLMNSVNKFTNLQEKIFNLLQNMDFSDPEQVALLKAIYEKMDQYEHVCNCMQNNTPGTEEIPNPDDLENRFN